MGHGRHGAGAMADGNGVPENLQQQGGESKMPLLTPYQLGPFKLAHRSVTATAKFELGFHTAVV
jgi:hypothetical protein